MKQIIRLLFSIIIFSTGQLSAQEQLEVQRCADIDRSAPIKNIFIDRDNNKWVADAQGLFLAQSPDYAKTIDDKADEWNLLSAPDGNKELYFPKGELEEIIGMDVNQITCASINKKKELWIGTADNGLFQLNTKNGLSLIKNLKSNNSKLRSNTIQSIFVTKDGALLAATDDGLFSKNGNKESLFSKGYDFTAIANNKGTIWVIADNEVLEMGSKGDLFETEFDERMFDGNPVDIDFDRKGNLWIASEVVVRYHFESETFDFFGPAEDFTSQSVKCIAADSDGALWVGTQNKGVFYIGKSSSLSGVVQVREYLDCTNGAKNAALEVRASGGEPPYTYQWNQGLTGETPKNLGPGTYSVTITDQKGKKATAEVTIKESTFTVEVRQVKEAALGGGKDGSAIVEIKGGNGTFKYAWDNGETTATALQLEAGEHTVTISETNGCVTTATVSITEKLGELTVNLQQTETIICAGSKNGALKATVSGGQAPYQYQWMGAAGFTEDATNLGAGDYKVVVTDSNNNTTVGEISIEEPKGLIATVKVKSPATANNADGKATVKAAGGTGKKYQYKWDTGETESTASKLPLGQHVVTVTDEKGCTAIANFDITEDILPLSLSLESSNAIKCAGDNTAALKAEVSGGKSPFTYAWSSADISGESASNLPAGDYSLTITDAAGTTATANAKIKAPEPLEVSLNVNASATTNNSDGKATATVKGGTGKYNYAWDNNENTAKASKLAPGNRQLVVTDANGCTAVANIEITENILPLSVSIKQTASIKCHGEKTAALEVDVQGGKTPFDFKWNQGAVKGEKASQLGGGNYELTLTDASGLSQTASIQIEEPAALVVTLDKSIPATNENSRDGKASLNVKGGTKPFSYSWDTRETTAAAAKLPVGNHSVTVSDANTCSTSLQLETKKKILPALTAGRLKKGQTLQVSNLYFEADSTNMTAASYPTLNEIASFLKDNPLVVIEVGGHTNNIPAPEFCDALSTARAKSVAEFIVKGGIDKNRVLYKGYGKREPKYSNNHKEGRAKNQRVELKILSLQ